MEKRRFNVGILITIILLLICAVGINGYGGEKRVLIASQSSDFKNEVVASLQEELKNNGIAFTVTDISVLRNVKEAEWDSIVIVHTVKMGKIKKQVKHYLDSVDNWEKVIVFTTYGSKDPVPDMYGIDSISAASEKEQIQTLTADLKAKLQNILNN
jgi:hypothetical protein